MTVTTNEAADLAGVSPATIRSWVLRGWLNPVRRGAKPLRFIYSEVAQCQRLHRSSGWESRHAEVARAWHLETMEAVCNDRELEEVRPESD